MSKNDFTKRGSPENTDFDYDLLKGINPEWVNEMQANRTMPAPQSKEKKAIKKAWAKKSTRRALGKPGTKDKTSMAHGMSMHQKKDAKKAGFSNPAQMHYYEKQKRRSELVRRDKEDVGEDFDDKVARSAKHDRKYTLKKGFKK